MKNNNLITIPSFILSFGILISCVPGFSESADQLQSSPPWKNKAPLPYAEQSEQVKNSYKEEWKESSVKKYPEAVVKAEKVIREWGVDPEKALYPDKNKSQDKPYKYELKVWESENFVGVHFVPLTTNGEKEHPIEIRMGKKDLEVLSILPGP